MVITKTLVAASLMSIALTSSALAQCVDCALYPDRDYLNNGAPTPAAKMRGAAGSNLQNSESSVNNPRNARAQMRDHRPRRSGRAGGADVNR